MIKPVLQDAAFLADVQEARADRDALHLWWLGQSGFLVQWRGQHVLFDPYLSDSLTKKYAGTDQPHVRLTERVVAPEELDFIDVITSSHNHTDHLDPETIGPLLRVNPRVELVIAEANREFVTDRLGIVTDIPVGLNAGGSAAVAGLKFHAVPAAHETVERDQEGLCKFLGYVVEFGPWKVYHSGDTVLFDGLVDWLRPWKVNVALLPINGRAPERRVAGNLWGREAAWLAKAIGAGCAIPCHYEMFAFNTASPDEFVMECRRLDQPCEVIRCGQRWSNRLPTV